MFRQVAVKLDNILLGEERWERGIYQKKQHQHHTHFTGVNEKSLLRRHSRVGAHQPHLNV
jgi:hypothetical protein